MFFFYLCNYQRTTYYIDMEPMRISNVWAYLITQSFEIMEHAKPLSELASRLPDIRVQNVIELDVSGEPATGGVGILLRPQLGK